MESTRGYSCIICYPLTVLLWNGGVCSGTHLAYTSRRSMYTIDHLFLGEGLHSALRVLLALIESVSILFRAVSLSLRVVCNSIAGHLLLAVLLEMTTSSTACCTASSGAEHLLHREYVCTTTLCVYSYY